jgi:alpha-1,6-mannosyltransferase
MKIAQNKYFIISLLLSTLAYSCINYVWVRSDFYPLVMCYAIVFITYFSWIKQSLSIYQIGILMILFRVLLLGGNPTLSDDFYRFIWDAKLLNAQHNPFYYLPSEILHTGVYENANLNLQLYQKLNSPNYYTCYPPMHQWIYGFAYTCSTLFWGTAIFWMKMMVILAEILTFFVVLKILKHLQIAVQKSALYFLNPLVILEFTGNLHGEVFMLLFIALAFLALIHHKNLLSGLFLGLAISTKLLPLILLPLLLFSLQWSKSFKIVATACIVFILSLVPFFAVENISFILQSISLFVDNFEFNASVYNLFKAITYQIYGYNTIGVLGWLLKLCTLLLILYISWKGKKPEAEEINMRTFSKNALIIWAIYLFLSTIVHPWYILPLLFFGMFTHYKFPVVWTAVIFLSYATYQTSSYTENFYLLFVQYILVLSLFVIEIFNLKIPALCKKLLSF